MTLMWMVVRVWFSSSSTEAKAAIDLYEGISVVIAARNEAHRIAACVTSILQNNFVNDNWEIIVINDHSTDDTQTIIESFNHPKVKILPLPIDQNGKKSAITYGVGHSNFSWIVTTDADCIVSTEWLVTHFNEANQYNILGVTGVVLPEKNNTLLSNFQWMDFAATMVMTNFGIKSKRFILANGANLGFAKSAFTAVNGYEGNSHLSSGDDVFLMQKIAKIHHHAVSFSKNYKIQVTTKSEPTWQSFFEQRKRWASKSKQSGNEGVAFIQGFVFTYCLMILAILLLGIFITPFLIVGWMALLLKMATDYIFLKKISQYYDYQSVMKSFLPSFFIYFWHIFTSAWFAIFPSKFAWKGRTLR